MHQANRSAIVTGSLKCSQPKYRVCLPLSIPAKLSELHLEKMSALFKMQPGLVRHVGLNVIFGTVGD